jgi:pyruvate dehydrogenase E1 component
MEGMFRQYGIWNQEGQKYVPEDHDQLMFYKESKTGQVLQEGINEAGAMADWIAAGTAYSVHNVQMIPFYIFYSMFGMQRTMDLCWAAGDQRTRGFLIGGTAGRTTLNGEGLQHEDGHSLMLANMIPNCISYDPTFQYEVAVVVQDGMRRMFAEQEDVYYYITVMNENYEHPGDAGGRRSRHPQGHVRLPQGRRIGGTARAAAGFRHHLPRSHRRRRPAQGDWGVEADIWGCPSFNELARNGQDVARWNLLHPMEEPAPVARRAEARRRQGPVIAATDYIRCSPSRSVPSSRHLRHAGHRRLRPFRHPREAAPLLRGGSPLGDAGRAEGAGRRRQIERDKVAAALVKYNLDPNKPNPMSV